MHGTFIAAGPGIRKQGPVANVRAIDVAPTLAFLMDIPGPQNASGKILYNLTAGPGQVQGDHVPRHLRLPRPARAADRGGRQLVRPAVNPVFPIGGSAFLKPWFDVYRGEAGKDHFTVAAGDSVGATPPISSFFGDTPTIELMNLMGFSADGLGNHNFDKGSAYLRNTLIPLAKFPYVSANVVAGERADAAQWKPSTTFNVEGGKLGLVGFTNEDAPTLVFPGAFDPFTVTTARCRRCRRRSTRCARRAQGRSSCMGHDGAIAGTLTAPIGPVVDLADALKNVDVVIGDHTNFQVLSTRPNGTLVVENLSKGVRFTRVRLVLDTSAGGVVYKTADFHKPWNIGVTPDPAIQARIDALNDAAPADPERRHRDLDRRRSRAPTSVRPRRRPAVRVAHRRRTTDAHADEVRPIGVDFAITNSGGLRDALTCSATDLADGLLSGCSRRLRTRSPEGRCSRCCRSATSSSR